MEMKLHLNMRRTSFLCKIQRGSGVSSSVVPSSLMHPRILIPLLGSCACPAQNLFQGLSRERNPYPSNVQGILKFCSFSENHLSSSTVISVQF